MMVPSGSRVESIRNQHCSMQLSCKPRLLPSYIPAPVQQPPLPDGSRIASDSMRRHRPLHSLHPTYQGTSIATPYCLAFTVWDRDAVMKGPSGSIPTPRIPLMYLGGHPTQRFEGPRLLQPCCTNHTCMQLRISGTTRCRHAP